MSQTINRRNAFLVIFVGSVLLQLTELRLYLGNYKISNEDLLPAMGHSKLLLKSKIV
jgi:hypothetical protein